MKVKVIVISIIIFISFKAKAQNYDCNCEQTFDKMIEKLEINYIAYHLIKAQINNKYESRKLKFKALSKQAEPQNCTKLLQEFLTFFKDGHLFVNERPNFSEKDLAETKSYLKANLFNVNYAIKFSQNPMEGYWTDGASKFVIVRNRNIKIPFEYVAIIIETHDTSKLGEMKFAINFSKNIGEGIYYTNNYASRYVKVVAYKDNSLLSI